ncbi:peptidoglycan DD-metalloendopeptidase family protein [Acuticoccus sp. MNP-M23]|uniref:peptidoglycan DD-metalloendopeptidase family protein n=1 Tax=Acuticoccus sp. MNP-M23 TaxID=3072793 RepID=UPI00281544DE|nr:peptidoglycan DD-metalloendopeptidase family protein [Acuticoccus sp. MNP-M23]WMS42411.1 peptidoglycan DD-metalloendopeptidase family protein [Acuticoccus sp. MNP-M23]
MRLAGTPLFGGNNAQPTPLSPIESAELPPAALTPGAQIGTPARLKAQGYTLENAPIVEIGAADTAQTIATGYGVPVSVLLEANGVARPEDVRVGMRLIVPVRAPLGNNPYDTAGLAGSTTAVGAQAAPVSQQTDGGRHVVQYGETLRSIAQMHRVEPAALAQLNNIPPTASVTLGQTLRIPAPSLAQSGPGATQVASLQAPTLTDATPTQPEAPAPNTLQAQAVQQAPAAAAAAPAAPAAVQTASIAPTAAAPVAAEAADSGFRWPVRGRIIAGFGKQADGARNDGINLAVPAGTPVHAAENGTVIYAGNELEGYGNLILVQHEGDWVSAYAHNETLKVSRGDKVSRGQSIASVGKSGSVEQPQLHFELRKKSKPVDPLPHLAGA